MSRLSRTPWIHVQPAGEDEAVHPFEKRRDLRFLSQRRHDHRQPPRQGDRLKVADIEAISAG